MKYITNANNDEYGVCKQIYKFFFCIEQAREVWTPEGGQFSAVGAFF